MIFQDPWVGAIVQRYEDDGTHRLECTGSLVSPQHLLTARHCITGNITHIIFGSLDPELPNERENTRQIRKILQENIINHDSYISPAAYYDISIITWEEPIDYTSETYPLCIPKASKGIDQYIDEYSWVVGYGTKPGIDNKAKNNLRRSDFQIKSNGDCNDHYGIVTQAVNFNNFVNNFIPNGITEKLICAKNVSIYLFFSM